MKKFRFIGKILVCLLLCGGCLLANISPAVAVQEPSGGWTYTTRVRMTPKADGAVIGQLEDGARVTVLDTKGDFYQVDCYDMVGYIAVSQVTQGADLSYYITCRPDSPETGILSYWEPAQALELRHSLLALAKEQLGSRYVYGGTRPGAFDCSGLTGYLYKQHGISLQRRASLQLAEGLVVPKEAMQVGDLVFFRQGTRNPASHVGIYAGEGRIIHAGTHGGVEYASLDVSYYAKYFLCARRIINTAGVLEPPMARGAVMPRTNGIRIRTIG